MLCSAGFSGGHAFARPIAGRTRPLNGGLLGLRARRDQRQGGSSERARQPIQRVRALPLQLQDVLASGGINHPEILAILTSGSASLVEPTQLPTLGLIPIGDLAEGLEVPVQLAYLLLLVGIVGSGAFVVIRQALIRRELDESAKKLGDSIRGGEASSEEYFELGAVLLRKKLFTQATKNLEKSIKLWDGEGGEIAQVHNALGYAYFNLEKTEDAIKQYTKAVELQPGYVSAWNNLGDAYEKAEDWKNGYNAYMEALSVAPDNAIAKQRSEYLKRRIDRFGIQPKTEKP